MAHHRRVTSRVCAAVDPIPFDDTVDEHALDTTPVRAVDDVRDTVRSVSALARERHVGPGRPSKLTPELHRATSARIALQVLGPLRRQAPRRSQR
jgi:hypothetical protein